MRFTVCFNARNNVYWFSLFTTQYTPDCMAEADTGIDASVAQKYATLITS